METHKTARPAAKRRPRRREMVAVEGDGGGGGGGGRTTRFGDWFFFLKTEGQFAFKVGETASRYVKEAIPEGYSRLGVEAGREGTYDGA